MTKADRLELDQRMSRLDYYAKLALEQCINYGMRSKRQVLAELRERQG